MFPLKSIRINIPVFAAIKNTNNKNSTAEMTLKANVDKTQIIPASITFKKDKNQNSNMIDKVTKSIQI